MLIHAHWGHTIAAWGLPIGDQSREVAPSSLDDELVCMSVMPERFLVTDLYSISRYSPCDNHTVSLDPVDASPDSASLPVLAPEKHAGARAKSR